MNEKHEFFLKEKYIVQSRKEKKRVKERERATTTTLN